MDLLSDLMAVSSFLFGKWLKLMYNVLRIKSGEKDVSKADAHSAARALERS
ncbi:MAG: hypothetical protein U0K86_08035 [Agathobacter sp.]|nr:hypothetical protein [Agathobacter sp.]